MRPPAPQIVITHVLITPHVRSLKLGPSLIHPRWMRLVEGGLCPAVHPDLPTPTPPQRRAFDLLAVSHRYGLT